MVRDSYGLAALNAAIEELDNRISGTVQLGLFAQVQDLLIDRMVWFLRNVELGRGLAEVVDHFRDGIAAVREGSTASCRRRRNAIGPRPSLS